MNQRLYKHWLNAIVDIVGEDLLTPVLCCSSSCRRQELLISLLRRTVFIFVWSYNMCSGFIFSKEFHWEWTFSSRVVDLVISLEIRWLHTVPLCPSQARLFSCHMCELCCRIGDCEWALHQSLPLPSQQDVEESSRHGRFSCTNTLWCTFCAEVFLLTPVPLLRVPFSAGVRGLGAQACGNWCQSGQQVLMTQKYSSGFWIRPFNYLLISKFLLLNLIFLSKKAH